MGSKFDLHGIIVATVNPAYTSQNCSRCDQRNTPNSKKYVCEHCGHTDHRDANAAFNIAKRGAESVSMGGTQDSVSLSGAVLVTPYSGGLSVCITTSYRQGLKESQSSTLGASTQNF